MVKDIVNLIYSRDGGLLMETVFTILQYLGMFLLFVIVIFGLYSLIRFRIKMVFIAVIVAFVTMLFVGCCEQAKIYFMSPAEQAQYKAKKESEERAREAREAAEKKAEEDKIAAEKAQKEAEAKEKAEKEAAEKAEREAKAAAEKQRKESIISLGDSPSKVKRLKGQPNETIKQTTDEGRFLWYTYYKNGVDYGAGVITYQFHNSSLASNSENE